MVDARFYRSAGEQPISALLERLGRTALWRADAGLIDRPVSGVAELETADIGDVAFVASSDFADALGSTRAGVVLLPGALVADVPGTCTGIACETAHLVFTELCAALYPDRIQSWVTGGGEPPKLEEGVRLGANVSIGGGVEIGEGSVIGANTVIGPGVSIGRDCVIGANCTIEFSYIGNEVVILPGVRLGTSGFGYLPEGGGIRPIPQLGRTVIQDRVEIGANSVVDRGALGDTVIGEGTKIGNLVVVAHNCRIGRNCAIIGFTGIAGSAVLEDNVLISGGGGLAGHIRLGEGTKVLAAAWVSKSFPPGSTIGGAPAQDVKTYWTELATLRRIAKEGRK